MKKKKPETAPVAAPARKAPTHICPKCQTAVAPPDDCLIVSVPGYQAAHCLKCWTDIIRASVPVLIPIPSKEEVAAVAEKVSKK